ncbi:type II toxin-antitoxin system HicA family toxin [Solibacillus sp. FSL R7-0682]|uniref:type II toxin-antitoxin system HicA family toxin n=1 Tax=Solibacillus sp. FSL R7-0682 TaxID=2921690 RepID=UPI0030F8C689
MKKVISSLMIFSLFLVTVSSTSLNVKASTVEKGHYINDDNLTEELILVDETEIEYNTTVAPIIAYLLRKAVVDAVKDFGKQAVIDAVMKELDLPKVISGKNLVKKLKKVGFEEVRQNGSHIIMKGPNGKTFPVPDHKEIAKGTYSDIKKQIKDAIIPDWL